MTDEFRDLVSNVKEQVMYLGELGVEAMDVRLPETTPAEHVAFGTVLGAWLARLDPPS